MREIWMSWEQRSRHQAEDEKAVVIAESFRGKSRVQQHKIVYDALKGEMGGKLHALALQTGTPEP